MRSHKETARFPYQNSYFRRSREIHTLPPEIHSLYYILLDDQRPAVGIVAAAVLNILQFVVHLQAALARLVTDLPFATRFLVVDIADRRDHRSRSAGGALFERRELVDRNGTLLDLHPHILR